MSIAVNIWRTDRFATGKCGCPVSRSFIYIILPHYILLKIFK